MRTRLPVQTPRCMSAARAGRRRRKCSTISNATASTTFVVIRPTQARGHWSVDDLKRTKDLCQKHGVSLDMVALPFLSSSHIDREKTRVHHAGRRRSAIRTSRISSG